MSHKMNDERDDNIRDGRYEVVGQFSLKNRTQFKCVLCDRKVWGYGNNPAPLATDGLCCEPCNLKVLLARIKLFPKEGI
jgi:DNA-directed RNA polymerase subunit RPC12/RpoP